MTIAAQWYAELKRCSRRVDQAWVTVISIIKDFTEFELRSDSQMRKIKNKIDELLDEDVEISTLRKINLAIGIANGMAYLHALRLIHR